MQRLTTIYGVFHNEIEMGNPLLNVHYDLREKWFFHPNDTKSITDSDLPLSSLFSPKRLLEFQRRLQKTGMDEGFIDDVLELQSAFQEYMIPVTTMQSSDVQHVVGIF